MTSFSRLMRIAHGVERTTRSVALTGIVQRYSVMHPEDRIRAHASKPLHP